MALNSSPSSPVVAKDAAPCPTLRSTANSERKRFPRFYQPGLAQAGSAI